MVTTELGKHIDLRQFRVNLFARLVLNSLTVISTGGRAVIVMWQFVTVAPLRTRDGRRFDCVYLVGQDFNYEMLSLRLHCFIYTKYVSQTGRCNSSVL